MRFDYFMSSLTEITVILSTAAVRKWQIVKKDVESALLQSGLAHRDVYVIPPRNSSHKNKLWLLLVTAYELVILNAKWQVDSDTALIAFRFKQLPKVSQLFYSVVAGTYTNSIVVKTLELMKR